MIVSSIEVQGSLSHYTFRNESDKDLEAEMLDRAHAELTRLLNDRLFGSS